MRHNLTALAPIALTLALAACNQAENNTAATNTTTTTMSSEADALANETSYVTEDANGMAGANMTTGDGEREGGGEKR